MMVRWAFFGIMLRTFVTCLSRGWLRLAAARELLACEGRLTLTHRIRGENGLLSACSLLKGIARSMYRAYTHSAGFWPRHPRSSANHPRSEIRECVRGYPDKQTHVKPQTPPKRWPVASVPEQCGAYAEYNYVNGEHQHSILRTLKRQTRSPACNKIRD